MTVVLALDVASNMGIAVGQSGSAPRAWSLHLGKPPDEAKFSKAMVATHKLIAEYKPDLIALEAPVGGPKTSHFLVGLLACVRGVAFNRGVRVEMCSIGAIRKHFIGKHLTTKHFPGKNQAAAKKAIKTQVIARCGLLGWHVEDDDAADAAALFDFACAVHCGALARPAGGLFV